ncbi:TPA: hypothetical protein ACUU7C_000695, partial [Campylobacter coli]
EYLTNVGLSKDTIVGLSNTLNVGVDNKVRVSKNSSEYVGENKDIEIGANQNTIIHLNLLLKTKNFLQQISLTLICKFEETKRLLLFLQQ